MCAFCMCATLRWPTLELALCFCRCCSVHYPDHTTRELLARVIMRHLVHCEEICSHLPTRAFPQWTWMAFFFARSLHMIKSRLLELFPCPSTATTVMSPLQFPTHHQQSLSLKGLLSMASWRILNVSDLLRLRSLKPCTEPWFTPTKPAHVWQSNWLSSERPLSLPRSSLASRESKSSSSPSSCQ